MTMVIYNDGNNDSDDNEDNDDNNDNEDDDDNDYTPLSGDHLPPPQRWQLTITKVIFCQY